MALLPCLSVQSKTKKNWCPWKTCWNFVVSVYDTYYILGICKPSGYKWTFLDLLYLLLKYNTLFHIYLSKIYIYIFFFLWMEEWLKYILSFTHPVFFWFKFAWLYLSLYPFWKLFWILLFYVSLYKWHIAGFCFLPNLRIFWHFDSASLWWNFFLVTNYLDYNNSILSPSVLALSDPEFISLLIALHSSELLSNNVFGLWISWDLVCWEFIFPSI